MASYLKANASAGIRWLKSLLRYARGHNSSVLVATPPPVILGEERLLGRCQRVYHRDSGSWFTTELGSHIDYVTFQQIFIDEDYHIGRVTRAAEIESRYRAILDRGGVPLVIDCGANIGLSSAYFKMMFPQARVVGIEPDWRNHAASKANTGRLADVEQHHAAIASEPGFAQVVDPGLGNNGYRTEVTSAGGVRMLTVEGILKEHPDAEPLLIKIDIEGFERNLFEKNIDWIDRFPLMIVELHDWMLPGEASSRPLLKALSQTDRDFVCVGDNIFSIHNDLAGLRGQPRRAEIWDRAAAPAAASREPAVLYRRRQERNA